MSWANPQNKRDSICLACETSYLVDYSLLPVNAKHYAYTYIYSTHRDYQSIYKWTNDTRVQEMSYFFFFLKKLNPIQAPTGQGWQKEQDQSDVSNALQEGTKNFKTENR